MPMRLASTVRFGLIALMLTGVAAPIASAVEPQFNVVYPRGGQRGTTVDVTFRGNRLSDAIDVMFHDEGISLAELTPKDDNHFTAKLAIAPDCPLGTHALRVRTRTGISNMQFFSVGNLNEIHEKEGNNDPETAQAISLGTTVNGTVTNEDVDYFAVELAAEGRLAVETEAIRLGTALFDIKVRLFSPGGHEVIAEDDTALVRQDAAFVFTAKEAGRHLIAVSEASYGGSGNYWYRMHVGEFPRPFGVTPWGGVPGSELEVTWLGDPALSTETVTIPAESDSFVLRARNESGESPTGLPFRLIDYPGVVESEPNDRRNEGTMGAVPGAFDGVIQEEGDVDWFQFEGKKGQRFDFRVWARELGSPLDSVLSVRKTDGSGLAGNDDNAGVDSAVSVTLPEDGVYSFIVRDHLRRGGPRFAYRVEALPPRPGLTVDVEDSPEVLATVHQGNNTFVHLTLKREHFDAAVPITFAGLPDGVTAEVGAIPGVTGRVPVLLKAAAEAPLAGALVDVRGTHASEGVEVTGGIDEDIVLVYGRNQTIYQTRRVNRLALAVGEPAPYSLEIVTPKAPIVRNGVKHLKVVAHRNEEFDAPIDLRVPTSPNNVGTGTAKIDKGQNETTIRIEASGNAPVATWNVSVAGKGARYDVCTDFTPLAIEEEWVTFSASQVETEQGKNTEAVIKLAQKKPFEGEFEAHLQGLPKGVSAEPQKFTKDTTELRFPLTVTADAPAGKHNSLRVYSNIMYEGEPVLHRGGGAKLVIYKPLPPELKKPEKPEPKKEEKKKDEPERKTRFGNT